MEIVEKEGGWPLSETHYKTLFLPTVEIIAQLTGFKIGPHLSAADGLSSRHTPECVEFTARAGCDFAICLPLTPRKKS